MSILELSKKQNESQPPLTVVENVFDEYGLKYMATRTTTLSPKGEIIVRMDFNNGTNCVTVFTSESPNT